MKSRCTALMAMHAALSCCLMFSMLDSAASQTCSAVGSLHFLTFDGGAVNFPYACKYVMAKTCSRLAPIGFEIRVKTKSISPQRQGSIGIQFVEVAAEGKTVRLSPDGRVHVDGTLASAYDYKCRLKVHRVPLGVELSILSANVSVTVSESGLVLVRIPESLKTLVCGLCGNYDGNKSNDYSSDTPLQWFIPDPTDSSCTSGPVTPSNATFYSSTDSDIALCRTMISKFVTCNETLQSLLSTFQDFCVKDVLSSDCSDLEGSACFDTPELCDCGSTALSDVTCRLGEALATQLSLRGCIPQGWRSQDISNCPKRCSGGSRYTENVSSCIRACSASNGGQCSASVSCAQPLYTDGCVCPEGQLWSGSSCVTNNNCACTFGTGLLYPVGSKWLDSTCSAEIECLPTSQLNYTMMQCSDNSECVNRNDQWLCQCRDGYTGDGRVACTKMCGPGNKVAETPDSCEPCPVGSYQPSNNTATSCIECPQGKLTKSAGSASINDCVEIDVIPADEKTYDACSNSFDCVKQVFVPVELLANGVPVGRNHYRSLWVSSNAVVSFGEYYLGRQTNNLLKESKVVIAPFWLRMDFRARGSSITIGEYSQLRERDKLQMVKKIFEPLAQYSTPTSISFVPIWALIITWTAAMPFPHQSSGTSENVTMQLVLASDGWTTKTAFIYPAGRLHLNSHKVLRSAEMGYNLQNGLAFRFYGSGTQLMSQLDRLESNTGIQGRWIFDLSQRTNNLAEQKSCLDWYSQQAATWTVRKPTSFSCPCDWTTALTDPNYHTYQQTMCVISLFKSPGYGFYQMCCYDQTITGSRRRLLTDLKAAGRPIQYNPNYANEQTRHLIYDQKPFLDCCIRTENCHLYRQYRPADSCVGYRPPTSGGGGGDPHFKTLDGFDYTFNAIGEFHLLRSPRALVQSRLGRFGSSNATEFKAIACQTLLPPSSRIHVELNVHKNGLLIQVKPPDLGAEANETRFYTGPETVRSYVAVTLIGTTTKIRIMFENGYGANIEVVDGMIQQSLYVPQSESGTVSGLLGNYDGNPLNDLIMPNGVLTNCTKSASESQCIHNVFGPAWRVGGNESILWYRDQLSTRTYTDYSFVPTIFDKSKVPLHIVEVCGNSVQCQYDFQATNNSVIAQATKSFVQALSTTRQTLGASRPIIHAVSEINAQVGCPVSVRLEVTSSLQGTVSLQALTAPPAATITKHNSTAFIFSWLPDKNTADYMKEPLRFIARDEANTTSATLTVKVAFCDCDVTGGTCVWPKTFGEFALVVCKCSDGWSGVRCSEDYDACYEHPCGDGGVCTDLPPGNAEQYECKCDPGYILNDELQTCIDIDECATKTVTCRTNEQCVNTMGSYLCKCASGYFKKNSSATCEDINECESGLLNDCQHVCMNYNGGYNCSCFAGFELVGASQCVKTAENLPECNRCPDACIISSTGQAYCACKRGFKTTENGSCQDIDECQDLPCGTNATCTNTPGSFNCACRVGFQIYNSSGTCEECPAGTYGTNCSLACSCGARARSCNHVSGCVDCVNGWTGEQCNDDINECESTIACPGLGLNCTNTKGSYICECSQGYQLSANGQECVDIDECFAINAPCKHGFKCDNTPGSYECRHCLQGFERHNDSCLDVDECLRKDSCSINAECENTLGSYDCRCTRGFYGDGLPENMGTGCVDIDECSASPGPCPSGSTCINTQGSFICSCNAGRIAIGDCCILLDATVDCQDKLGCSACCLLGGGFSCTCNGNPPAGAVCMSLSNNFTTTTDQPVSTTPARSNVTSSIGVLTIVLNQRLEVELPDSDEALAKQHLLKAVEQIFDPLNDFLQLEDFTATSVKRQNENQLRRKRSIADRSVYNVSYSATFLFGREKANEIVFYIAAAIVEANFSVKSYADTTVHFISPLFYKIDERLAIEATCESLEACPGHCLQFSQLLPKCSCPDGTNSYRCLPATEKPKAPEIPDDSDYLPLWITAGVLGGILTLALITVLIVIIVRRHRKQVNLHRHDMTRRPDRDDRATFGEYLDGIFRPFGRPTIHRRSRSESTSTASSNSTESYHSSPEGRVGLAVPFGPRWPKAYKGPTRPSAFDDNNDGDN